jgi:hypothetical protein
MRQPHSLGRHSEYNREILILSIDSFEDAAWQLDRPGQFTCFCAADADGIPTESIARFCSRLLELGCAYLCTWGPDCERVHNIMDGEDVRLHPPTPDSGCVMTTWHAGETLDRALWFFFECTGPDESYASKGCDTGLIIVVGRPDWYAAADTFAGLAIWESQNNESR